MSGGRDAGFTLIELLVVIAILTGMAMLAGPHLTPGGGGGAMRRAQAQVAAQLASAREAAIRDGRPRCLAVPAAIGTSGCNPLFAPPRIAIHAAAPGTVRFFGDGSSDGQAVTLVAGARQVTLSVIGPTGQIVVR